MHIPHRAQRRFLFARGSKTTFTTAATRAGKQSLQSLLLGPFFALTFCAAALAGGGGQRLILVVNPGDEHQVRIANEYQRLRAIPDCNIVFIEPRVVQGFYRATEAKTATGFSYVDTYLKPIADHIAAEGLSTQIDYIASLGQPFRMTGLVGGAATAISHDYALTYLDSLAAGTTPEAVSSTPFPRDEVPGTYVEGTNEALLHSTDGLYLGTTLAFTGIYGSAPADVIADLQRTAEADGTRPAGTIYFEENDDVRSNTREPQWPLTQAGLTARGIPFIQEFGVSGSTPLNRPDVRGAVIGRAAYTITNGSTYLPGSWADSLTSFGTNFDTASQTKAAELIRAGAGGSSGTVIEPFAIAARFPHSHIFLYSADGSTIGEAFYKSVATPLLQLMLGDPLGQPYADVPSVTIDSGPAEGATVAGTVPLMTSAALSSPNLATGISRMELYIDGKFAGTSPGGAATFNVDTTTLSDGRHELRVVAVNNAAAASQDHVLRHVHVDNDGRSVSAGGDVAAGTATSVMIPVTSTAGSGTVTRIELRHLGRNVGQVSGGSGNVNLDAAKLAWGGNTVTPVAVFTGGSEVAGDPIDVSRAPAYLAATTPLPPRNRLGGVVGEYFIGQGGTSINASTFTEPPDTTGHYSRMFIGVHDGVDDSFTRLGVGALTEAHVVGSVTDITQVDELSARFTARFEAKTGGEYSFFLSRSNDSMRLLIDGQVVIQYNNLAAGLASHYSRSVFLAAGEHNLELLAANTNTGSSNGFFDIALYVRKPDGVTQVVDDTLVYQFLDRPDPRVVGYWRHDETGASGGGTIGAVVNVAGPGTVNGQGITGAVFSTDLPGPAVFDPITGIKRPNAFAFNATNTNSRVRILNNSALDVDNEDDRSFTIEFFLKIGTEHPGSNAFARRLVTGPDPDDATSSDRHAWQVDFDHGTTVNFGKLRARWDLPGVPAPDFNRTARGGYVYVDTDGATGNPADYTFATGDPAAEGDGTNDDTSWHHVAVVYDDTSREFAVYTDYQRFNSNILQGAFSHPPANLEYGNFGSSNTLLFDEVRYTEGVLDETLFLQATTFTAIEAWRLQHFGFAENTGIAADLVDPNVDGIVNLLAFAFAIDPQLTGTGALPQPALGGNAVTFNFMEPPGVAGILYGAEFSTDLIHWFPITDTGSGANHIFSVPTTGEPRLFVRLLVTPL